MNSEFCFSSTRCPTKAKEPSLPYYLPLAGGRINGFIPFPGVLVLCEIQTTWPKIWTCPAVSISYDDIHYTMDTSIWNCIAGSSPKMDMALHNPRRVDWFGFVWFYVISTIVGYLCQNNFYAYKHFYFKQFSFA